MNRRFYPLIFAALPAIVLQGCAASRSAKPLPHATTQPIELQTLDTLQPPLVLPPPVIHADREAPAEALQFYAQGREALLGNDKAKAIDKFKAALALDSSAVIVQRDLGFAYLGTDNALALNEFRQVLSVNPYDGDARIETARLHIENKQLNEAIVQLRLARFTPQYGSDTGYTAVVDLLLGRLLETQNYRRAALECYEKLISAIDTTGISRRGHPELAEMLSKPAALFIRTADLASLCGFNDRAIALYQRVQEQEPELQMAIEMRIARAQILDGHPEEATRRALTAVTSFHGSRAAVRSFVDIFDGRGGVTEALRQLDKSIVDGPAEQSLNGVRAQILLNNGEAKAAVREIDRVKQFDLSTVRTLVLAYRAAGMQPQLLKKMIEITAAQPERWAVISHGWTILTQGAQANPLGPNQIESLEVSPQLLAAKQFVLSNLYQIAGQPLAAKRAADASRAADARFNQSLVFKDDSATAVDLDFTDLPDLANFLIDLSDDPALLESAIVALLRDGRKPLLQKALQSANASHPGNVVLGSMYAQILSADQQTVEALAVLERATTAATSVSELYQLSSQYAQLGDNKLAESALRKAYDKDPQSPSVCNDLGFLLADAGREIGFAEQLIWRATGLEPDNPAYLDSLGWVLYKRSDFEQAARYLRQSIQLMDLADPTVLDHAGDALYRGNKFDEAKTLWRQGIENARQRGASDPQFRLRLESKVRQLDAKQPVDVAPVVDSKPGI